MDPIWLLLLLPIAAASGWFAATRARSSRPVVQREFDLPGAYLKGLNFVLNEQPDKAIEVFVRALEVDSDTVDMHLALGNLFRRRGEVERATRIHQNLIAKTTLDKHQRAHALYELGQDYFKAGLYDRAESLFLESSQVPQHSNNAFQHLLQIYDQEKEWESAISIARKMKNASGQDMSGVIAQYYCEMAEVAISEGRYRAAQQFVNQALADDVASVRALIQSGRLHALTGEHELAISAWRRVEEIDPDYLGEVVDLIANSYRELEDNEGFRSFLKESVERRKDGKLMSALVDLLDMEDGTANAELFLVDWVRRHPTVHGLHRLIQVKQKKSDGVLKDDLRLLESMIGGLLGKDSAYECRQCGFAAKSLHWQCPSCKSWNTLRPRNPRSFDENFSLHH